MFIPEREGSHSGVAEFVDLLENTFVEFIYAPRLSKRQEIFTHHTAEHFK
jgi:hypothetical protein